MELALRHKDTRLHVRCRTPEKDLIERAAEALGMSVSDYILSTMIERSATEIQRLNRLRLTEAAHQQLRELMDSEIEPSPALATNLADYRRAVAEGTLTVAD